MNSSARLLTNSLVGRMRSAPQGSLNFVRNAGGAPAPHGPMIPFPPGPRQFEQLKNWFGSAGVFGATAFGLLCYLSDWKVVVAYIPFYNAKFQDDEPEKK